MNKQYSLAKEYTTAMIGDELGILDVDKGSYYVMNPVAGKIFNLLEEGPVDLESLCSRLSQLFEENIDVIRQDTLIFLEELIEKEIINVTK